jgi:hypothetical protein
MNDEVTRSRGGGLSTMRIPVLLCSSTLLLAACGGGQTDLAVEACADAIEEKFGDRNFRIDRGDMAAKAKAEGEDIVHVQSSVVFDAGLPREYTQTFDCRARFAAGNDKPDVISLSFNW